MLEFLKTPAGAYNLTFILAILGWLVSGVGIFAGFHLTKVRAIESEEKARQAEVQRIETAEELRIAKAEAAAAKKQVDELEIKQRPRVIDDKQHQALVAALKAGPKGKVVVTFLSVEGDAQKYAEQITSIFTDAGFDVTLSKKLWLQLALDGVYIAAKEKGAVPLHGPFIQQCFKEAGIPVGGFYDPKFLSDVGAPDDGVVFAVSNRH